MVSSLRGGGSEQQTLLLLQHLDREQFTPQLYLLDRDGDWLSRVPADVQVHAYSDARRPAAVYVPGRALRDQTQHLQQLIRQQSIDIVYDRTFHMTMIAGPACARVSVPRVSTIVSPPEFALPSVEKKFVRLKRRRLARAYRQSHAVVAVSQAAAKSAAGYYGIAADQIHVIPNGVDAKAVWIAAQQVNVDRDERLTLVCMGRMTAEKGHADLIDAVAETESGWPPATPPIRLWMIGD
jgi:glycosyltransferase involved in cell wall biosynthesis